jgi:hypothetical protein
MYQWSFVAVSLVSSIAELGMGLGTAYLHYLTVMQVVRAQFHPVPAAVGRVDLPPLPDGEVRQTEAGCKLNNC